MKTTPILISDGADRANQEIQDHNRRARVMTELIASYNQLPHLGKIDNAVEVKEFLLAPLQYLDESISNELGTGLFSGKIRPAASKIAELYGLNYNGITQRINGALPHLANLTRFGFDEITKTIILLQEGEDEIREKCRQYLTSENEIAAYNKDLQLCGLLNEFCDRYGIGPLEKNQLPRYLGLRVEGQGKGYTIKPNLEMIRKLLKK